MPKVLTGEDKLAASAQSFTASAHFPAVRDTVLGRCAMCHAVEPSYEGIYHAPKGVMLESDAAIAEHAREIYLQAGRSHAMPPGNVTQITPARTRAAGRLVRGSAAISMDEVLLRGRTLSFLRWPDDHRRPCRLCATRRTAAC